MSFPEQNDLELLLDSDILNSMTEKSTNFKSLKVKEMSQINPPARKALVDMTAKILQSESSGSL